MPENSKKEDLSALERLSDLKSHAEHITAELARMALIGAEEVPKWPNFDPNLSKPQCQNDKKDQTDAKLEVETTLENSDELSLEGNDEELNSEPDMMKSEEDDILFEHDIMPSECHNDKESLAEGFRGDLVVPKSSEIVSDITKKSSFTEDKSPRKMTDPSKRKDLKFSQSIPRFTDLSLEGEKILRGNGKVYPSLYRWHMSFRDQLFKSVLQSQE